MVVIGLPTGGRFEGGVTKRTREWLILFALGRLLGRVGCGGNRIGFGWSNGTDCDGDGCGDRFSGSAR